MQARRDGRGMTKVAAVLAAAAMAIAACGDSDDDGDAAAPADESTTTVADTTTSEAGGEGELVAFCDALVTLDTTLSAAGPQGPDPAAADAAIQTVQDTAPGEIADAVERQAELTRQAFGGDESIFEDPEFSQLEAEVDQYAVANCDYEAVEVIGVDHAYEGVSETLPAGQVALTLTNDGNEFHEAAVIRINDDVDASIQELLQLPMEEAITMITPAGRAFAPPGQSSTTFLDLEPGRYALVCFLPVGSTPEATEETTAENPPHFTQGMVAEVTVE